MAMRFEDVLLGCSVTFVCLFFYKTFMPIARITHNSRVLIQKLMCNLRIKKIRSNF